MSTRRGDRSDPFDFVQCVRDCLALLVKAETTEKDMNQCVTEFMTRMDRAKKKLQETPGLDMTEEEQYQRIADLEEAISQKERLIAECQKCFESWQDQPV
jgi:hypothetical protein